MEEQLKEMLGKRPNELEGETLKLFNAIIKIGDERDKLREENKELKKLKEKHNVRINDLCALVDTFAYDSIPKSKVKEKIEEYKKREKCKNGKYCNNCCNYYARCKTLQELLEE